MLRWAENNRAIRRSWYRERETSRLEELRAWWRRCGFVSLAHATFYLHQMRADGLQTQDRFNDWVSFLEAKPRCSQVMSTSSHIFTARCGRLSKYQYVHKGNFSSWTNSVQVKRGACHSTHLVLAVRKVSRAYTESCAFHIINAGATKWTEHRRIKSPGLTGT